MSGDRPQISSRRRPGRALGAVAAATLLMATPAPAQQARVELDDVPRPCIDMTGDGRVDISDVVRAFRAAAALDPGADPRADFDQRFGVNIADVVSDFLVAQGSQSAIIDFSPRAAAPGEEVRIDVANLRSPDGQPPAVLFLRPDGEPVRAEVGDFAEQVVRIRVPSLEALGDEVLGAPTAVQLAIGDQRSNVCRLRVLRPGDDDDDGDGVPRSEDNCPEVADPMVADTDGDGLGDLCDNCPAVPNPEQADRNRDGAGDACAPPQAVRFRGRVADVQPGIDGELAAQIRQRGRGHGVLQLTREPSPRAEALLREAEIEVLHAVARNVFIVALGPDQLGVIPDVPGFRALFPLRPIDRLGPSLVDLEPGEAPLLVQVEFYADVSLDEAQNLLREYGAEILSNAVTIGNLRQGAVVVNQWLAQVPSRVIPLLAELDQVFTLTFVPAYERHNANSRAAVDVGPVNAAGLNGNGMTVAEWDGGWVNGDDTGPPTMAANDPPNVHPALTGRVIIRDHGEGMMPFEGIAPPMGCATSFTCRHPNPAVTDACDYGNHGTHVAGTMMGDGTLVGGMAGPDAGMASMAQLISYKWPYSVAEMQCERRDAIANFDSVAHNNSWGFTAQCTNIGVYDTNWSDAYDDEVRSDDTTEVFSAGNNQTFRNAAFCGAAGLYSPGACAAPPAGVAAPPAIAAPPAGIGQRFYTLGSPGGTTKNGIVVANIDDVNNRMSNSSSWGPSLDRRLRPEVAAHGTQVNSSCVAGRDSPPDPVPLDCPADEYYAIGGTSMSAPAVTGVVSLLYERAQALGLTFNPHIIRALLTHTAVDLGVHPGAGGAFLTRAGGNWNAFGPADGPDYLTGYGLVDADAARLKVNEGNDVGGLLKPSGCPTGLSFGSIPFESPVEIGGAGPVPGCPGTPGSSQPMVWDVVWYVDVPPGTERFKVTVAWSDPGGADLVNDLDVILEEPGGGQRHFSWWLDPTCPYRQAVRVNCNGCWSNTHSDHDNTLEQVDAIAPPGGTLPAGQWRLIVRSDGVTSGGFSGTQPFSMVIDLE